MDGESSQKVKGAKVKGAKERRSILALFGMQLTKEMLLKEKFSVKASKKGDHVRIAARTKKPQQEADLRIYNDGVMEINMLDERGQNLHRFIDAGGQVLRPKWDGAAFDVKMEPVNDEAEVEQVSQAANSIQLLASETIERLNAS